MKKIIRPLFVLVGILVIGEMQAFNVDTLVKGLRGIEDRAPKGYIPFYLTVPREVVLKNKMASFLANVLKKKGESHVIDEQSQKPLLNYLASIVKDKPVLAEFRPRKLVDKKSKKPRLMRQKVFGSRKELSAKDFSSVAAYKVEALDDLLKLANNRMRDNAGGQMLIQLFIPKDKVDTIAQARLKGEQYAIDQLMQPGPDLNKRLVNARALLYLQPDADYTFVKLMMHDLSPREDRAKLDKQMGGLLVKVADQVAYAAQHPPEPLPRDHEKADTPPSLPPRDHDKSDGPPPLPPRDHGPVPPKEEKKAGSPLVRPPKRGVQPLFQAQLIGQKRSSASAKTSKKEPISLSIETLSELKAKKSKKELEVAQPMDVEPAFDKEKLFAELHSREKQAAPYGYVPLYFAVPREIILKRSIMSFLDKKLGSLGHDKIINQMYQYPLLNYIVFRAQSKPISVQSQPETLTSKSMLSRQGEFGSFKKFGIDDFADIKKYNPVSLSELVAVANSRVEDDAGGQMLAQLFVPKNALNKVVSRGKISLKPGINYSTFKLFTSDLQSPQKVNAQNKKMGVLIQQVAKQVSDAIKNPVVQAQPAKKAPVRKKAPGGLLGEIQAGTTLRKPAMMEIEQPVQGRSAMEQFLRENLQAGLKRQRRGAGTATGAGQQKDEEGQTYWTIRNNTALGDDIPGYDLEVKNVEGETKFLWPGEADQLSHKSSMKLQYKLMDENENIAQPKDGENYKPQGTINTRKHIIEFNYHPRDGINIVKKNIVI